MVAVVCNHTGSIFGHALQ